MLINVAIAVFAGALSSVLIFIFTHGFSVNDGDNEPGRALAGDRAATLDVTQYPGMLSGDGTSISEDRIFQTSVTEEIMQLQATVAAAAEERTQLTATIVKLNRQVAELEANVINLGSLPVLDADSEFDPASSEAMPGIDGVGSAAGFRGEAPAARQFESLLAAGLDEQTARDLQLRADQYQLARLELFDQAAREGWADSEQLNERLDALGESQPDLRSELGETAYDRYLYESGRANRVGIASIISGSAADLAGLQTGDLIFSYADVRIFTVQELQDTTRAGNRGEYVTVLVDRNSEIQRTDIERGPMGVTLQSSRQQP